MKVIIDTESPKDVKVKVGAKTFPYGEVSREQQESVCQAVGMARFHCAMTIKRGEDE